MIITLKTPNTLYRAQLDTEVMQVEITKAFLGPIFKTEDGEELLVIMRDSGFELRYVAPGCQRIDIRLNNGSVEQP